MTIRKSRRILSLVIPAVALLGGLTGCGTKQAKLIEPSPNVVRAEVFTIGDQSTGGTYPVTGTVRSLLNATLSSKASGRVQAVYVHEGDPIRRGQLLVAIDPRELQSAVRMADADRNAAAAGVRNAETVAAMESQTSKAQISQAEAQVQQAEAALASAEARRDLLLAGPRIQEVEQSHIAVLQAESNYKLAKIELERTTKLVEAGALAIRDRDQAQNQFDLAKGQYDAAVQAESMAREGSRTQEIRAAKEAVAQAQAAVRQARSGVAQAKASAMQVDVRRRHVEVAKAQTRQAEAAAESARVSLSYCAVSAPFDGRIVGRLVDPGSMASSGVPLLRIEGGEYRLEAVVPEKLLAGLAQGVTAQVQIEALPGRQITGRVAEILPQGDSTSHSFLVKFSLGTQPGLKSGMFGRALLRTGATNRFVIPASATWVREGLNYVFAINKEGIARLRIVTLGEASEGKVEVLSGLNKGDVIVAGDLSNVSDGAKIEGK